MSKNFIKILSVSIVLGLTLSACSSSQDDEKTEAKVQAATAYSSFLNQLHTITEKQLTNVGTQVTQASDPHATSYENFLASVPFSEKAFPELKKLQFNQKDNVNYTKAATYSYITSFAYKAKPNKKLTYKVPTNVVHLADDNKTATFKAKSVKIYMNGKAQAPKSKILNSSVITLHEVSGKWLIDTKDMVKKVSITS